jgi:hypothetical protein
VRFQLSAKICRSQHMLHNEYDSDLPVMSEKGDTRRLCDTVQGIHPCETAAARNSSVPCLVECLSRSAIHLFVQ